MGVINGVPNPPYFQDFMSIQTPFGLLTSPASRVAAYVCSSGAWDGAPVEIRNATVTTLDLGLQKCRTGFADIVYVLPGHLENVTATTCILAQQVAGAQVIGIGHGALRPRFTWTATTGIWNVTVSSMRFTNLILDVGGANGVVNSILFTGTDNTIDNCEIIGSSSATLYSLIPIQVAATAHRCTITRNLFRSVGVIGAVTEWIQVAGTSDLTKITHNEFLTQGATSLTINVAGAATRLVIANNEIAVTAATAPSVGVIVLANAISTGYVSRNTIYNIVAGNAFAGGITLGGASLCGFWDNRNCDEILLSAVLTPVVGT